MYKKQTMKHKHSKPQYDEVCSKCGALNSYVREDSIPGLVYFIPMSTYSTWICGNCHNQNVDKGADLFEDELFQLQLTASQITCKR